MHDAGIRLTVDAYRTGPLTSVCVADAESPFELYRKYHVLSYSVRCHPYLWHPARNLVMAINFAGGLLVHAMLESFRRQLVQAFSL